MGNLVSSLDPILFLFLVCITFACAELAFFCTVPRLPNNYSCNSDQAVSSDLLVGRRTSAVISRSFDGEEFGDKKNPTEEGLKSYYSHHSFCASSILFFAPLLLDF
jgi:hypothetical protein